MSTELAGFRDRFPGLRSMAYLASCSQGALSDAVADALTEFRDSMVEHGNPWSVWVERVDRARRGFADLIGAADDEVAVLTSASECAYQVASGLAWEPGGSVVTSELEFPSVAQVWGAQSARGAGVRFAATTGGFATVDGYDRAIDASTRLVSAPLVSYRHGQRLPVGEIAALARRRGAQVFVDAYQGAGVEPIDVAALDCDYLVSGTTKYLLGVPGLAFLYVRRGTHRDLDPQLTGWFGRADPFAFDPRAVDFPAGARRYEVGSPPVPAAYAADAGMAVLAAAGVPAIARHVAELTAHLHAELVAAGERVASPTAAGERGPMVAIRVEDPERVAAELAGQRIVVSPRGALLRLAVHGYTDHDDVNSLLRALAAQK